MGRVSPQEESHPSQPISSWLSSRSPFLKHCVRLPPGERVSAAAVGAGCCQPALPVCFLLPLPRLGCAGARGHDSGAGNVLWS